LGPSGGSDSTVSLNMNINIANVLGYKVNVDDDLSAAYNTNPT